eukprot:6463155-Pyramimonas_sp.AAC.1
MISDQMKQAPLHVACSHGRLEIIKFLLEKDAIFDVKDGVGMFSLFPRYYSETVYRTFTFHLYVQRLPCSYHVIGDELLISPHYTRTVLSLSTVQPTTVTPKWWNCFLAKESIHQQESHRRATYPCTGKYATMHCLLSTTLRYQMGRFYPATQYADSKKVDVKYMLYPYYNAERWTLLVTARGEEGPDREAYETPLWICRACVKGHLDVAKVLLTAMTPMMHDAVNIPNKTGMTPLHFAATTGQREELIGRLYRPMSLEENECSLIHMHRDHPN